MTFCGPRPCEWRCGGVTPQPGYPCDFCNDQTLVDPMPARMTQWQDGTCNDCDVLNNDYWLPMIADCRWELNTQITLCGELCSLLFRADATNNGWAVLLDVHNPSFTIFYQMTFTENTGGAGTGECNAERIIPNDSQTATGSCLFPLNGTVILNNPLVPLGSSGAMRIDSDCQPEFRRGKPFIPKGSKKG